MTAFRETQGLQYVLITYHKRTTHSYLPHRGHRNIRHSIRWPALAVQARMRTQYTRSMTNIRPQIGPAYALATAIARQYPCIHNIRRHRFRTCHSIRLLSFPN